MLEVLGVSADDERIYRSLLRQPAMTAAELGRALDRDVDSIGLALGRLEDLGLVTRLAGGGLVATRPDVAVDVLVARKQQELARAQAEAISLLDELPKERVADPEEHLEIVLGREAVAHRFMQLEQTCQDELLVLDRPPYAQNAAEPNVGELQLLARGVGCRGIYAPDAFELPGKLERLREAIAAGEQARMHTDLPLKLAISDRSAALLPLSGGQSTESALVIHASTLLEALIALFDMLWKSAVPVPADGPLTDREGTGPVAAVHDADLLTLLASGLKDDSIARQLGISARTLSRRAGVLMDQVGARTRFQCGMQAVRLGLID